MRTHAPVNFLPPNPLGLCGQAWTLFAKNAAANTPVVSAQLPAIAAATGFNLGNLKIELSRYNRYTNAVATNTLVAPPAKTSALAANAFMQAEEIQLRTNAVNNAPMLALPTPVTTKNVANKHSNKK